MKTTKTQQLILDAGEAGYEVIRDHGATTIRKMVKLNKTATRETGLILYANGTAFDLNVADEVACGIRSTRVMREVLGL